jgi:hypothetical protein
MSIDIPAHLAAGHNSRHRSRVDAPPTERWPLRVRLGRSLWSSRAPASPSPADVRHGRQVIALGPMLPGSDRFRFFGKKSQMARRDFRVTVPETLRDGRRSRRLGQKLCPRAITAPHRTAAHPSMASVACGWRRWRPWAKLGSRPAPSISSSRHRGEERLRFFDFG